MTEYIYSRESGLIYAETEGLLEEVQGEMRNALGQSIDLDSSTPQGTLVSAEVVARSSVMRREAEYANLMNPNYAYGKFLDAVCAFLGLERDIDQSTILRQVAVSGNPSTFIPAGSRVQDSNGVIFSLIDPVTINENRTAVVDLISELPGPFSVAPQTLTILDGTVGWGSITVVPTTITELGSVALKDGALKNLRRKTLAKLGVGSTGAILAAVLAAPNVRSALVVENNTGSTGVKDGVTFTLPNAVWVCVAGEFNEHTVAEAIYSAHHMGVPYDYGTSSGTPVQSPLGVQVFDPYSKIAQMVKYVKAVEYAAYFKVKVRKQTGASTPTQSIKDAITAYGRGEIAGEDGFVVGASIYAFDVAGAVAKEIPGVAIVEVKVACVPFGNSPPPDGNYAFEFAMPKWGIATTNAGFISVEVL